MMKKSFAFLIIFFICSQFESIISQNLPGRHQVPFDVNTTSSGDERILFTFLYKIVWGKYVPTVGGGARYSNYILTEVCGPACETLTHI